MGSPALEIPKPNMEMKYESRLVNPSMTFTKARELLLTDTLISVSSRYEDVIRSFGLEWSPESFPFRELSFALVSIASDQAAFHCMHETQGDKTP